MSDQAKSDTSSLTLNIDQARALRSESNPAEMQALAALTEAALLIHEMDWDRMPTGWRADLMRMFVHLNTNIRRALFEAGIEVTT